MHTTTCTVTPTTVASRFVSRHSADVHAFHSRAVRQIRTLLITGLLLLSPQAFAIDASAGINLGVMPLTKMLGGNPVTFWVYCVMGAGATGPGSCADPQLPGPLLELGVGATANITLTLPMMMMAGEPAPYDGHTIHFHGLDVPQTEDGVPETGSATSGHTYTFSVDSRYVGSHKYHCHVHTVKHLEMGMYGPFVVRAVDGSGGFVNTINNNGPAWDFEWNLLLSAVDPRYHTAEGDSTVFASYDPQYFLINGNEGAAIASPADTLTATPGASVAIRLIGLQSVNASFQITDTGGVPQNFVLHNMDGFALNTPQTVNRLDLSPGQTRDIMITLPSAAGSLYPEVTYRHLRDDTAYATVFTTLNF